MNNDLKTYIETEIIPRYDSFDKAHSRDHALMVVEQSIALSHNYQVNADMVYAIAAYHDLGMERGRKNHHIDSGQIIKSDQELRRWFSAGQITTMAEAVEDHRASSDHAPRSIYGRIVAEADRFIDALTIIRRTVQFGLNNHPELDRQGQWNRCYDHLQSKYGDGGYLKLWIDESPNIARLEVFREIIRNKELLHNIFIEAYQHEISLETTHK